MQTKILELRDKATFIPVVAIDMNPTSDSRELYLLRRAGYSCDAHPIILLTRADGGATAEYDPFSWSQSRTWRTAHLWITDHWRELDNGDVVDVEFILGETTERKLSERVTT